MCAFSSQSAAARSASLLEERRRSAAVPCPRTIGSRHTSKISSPAGVNRCWLFKCLGGCAGLRIDFKVPFKRDGGRTVTLEYLRKPLIILSNTFADDFTGTRTFAIYRGLEYDMAAFRAAGTTMLRVGCVIVGNPSITGPNRSGVSADSVADPVHAADVVTNHPCVPSQGRSE